MPNELIASLVERFDGLLAIVTTTGLECGVTLHRSDSDFHPFCDQMSTHLTENVSLPVLTLETMEHSRSVVRFSEICQDMLSGRHYATVQLCGEPLKTWLVPEDLHWYLRDIPIQQDTIKSLLQNYA